MRQSERCFGNMFGIPLDLKDCRPFIHRQSDHVLIIVKKSYYMLRAYAVCTDTIEPDAGLPWSTANCFTRNI